MIIDFYHDTTCPWSRIAKKQLDDSLRLWWGEPVVVRWRPFFLHEDVPLRGIDFRDYVATRRGGVEGEAALVDAVSGIGAQLGLTFRFDLIRKMPDTLPSHRLIALAPPEQRGRVIDALHRAYFEEGRDISDIAELAATAAQCGLDAPSIAKQLRGSAALATVVAEAEIARLLGVTETPSLVIDNNTIARGTPPGPILLEAIAGHTPLHASATTWSTAPCELPFHVP